MTSGDGNTIDTPGTTKQYPDRPASDVDAGLAKLDACDLVDTAVLDQHGVARRGLGTPRRNDPVSPGITGECKTVDNDLFGAVWVRVGGEFLESARYVLDRVEIGGFTAYAGDISAVPDEWICTIAFPVSFTRGIEIVVKARRGTDAYDPCQTAWDLGTAAVDRVTAAAGESFLYRPDEKDENVEGACVHYINRGSHEDCVPYRKPTLPADAQLMVERAHSNANISCAAALPIVRDVLGHAMQPVTYGQSCVFVEATHTITVHVSMSNAYRAAEYDFDETSEATEVAGHPAVVDNGRDSDGSFVSRGYKIATRGDAEKAGVVGVEIHVSVGRGNSPSMSKADPSKLDSADTIAAHLMERYF